ncbi:hypothetical protein L195_g017250 [Trifolium pratense]|uniref:Uncharacterized protein n=1 Tax=Trifolium pratense TaxID=57577 RepID=A0A2K3MTD6_TRIPR|nr:hypothetical protein L195_g017250 [Trifolium pratense]
MLKVTSLEHLITGGVLKCNSNALSDVENKTRLNYVVASSHPDVVPDVEASVQPLKRFSL